MSKSYFEPLVIGGEPVDLLHLEPFTLLVPSVLAKKTLRVRVTYSTHCFSEKYGAIPHPPSDPIIDVDTKQHRTFCPIRYGLSKGLPAVIRGMTDSDVFQTSAVRNWVYSITIENPAGPYHVFFEVNRASAEQRTWQDLNLVVESAYPEDDSPPSVRGKKPFALVCGEVYTGQRHRPKKR